MGQARVFIYFLIFAIVGVGYFSVFLVDERERAIKFRLGEIVGADFKPGLHFKMPFINNVKKFDGRIQTLDSKAERFLTSEKKNVLVDTYVKWRISDVERFYTAVAGSFNSAELRLDQIIKDGLRSEVSKRTIRESVSGERTQIMSTITGLANESAAEIGVEVVDVRIKRVDLPQQVSESVFQRMEAERARVSRDFRSRGREAAERIRADADRQRTVTVAEAYRDSEQTRGEGDAKAAEIYAKAYNQDPEFYALTRSLTSYKKVFSNAGDVLLLEPDAEFFRYFKSLDGK